MNASGSYQDLFNNDTSSDLFAGLVPNSVVITDHESLLQSVPVPDGKFLVGAASGVRSKSLKGTARQISVTHSTDDVTLVLPQDIDTLAEPTFANVHSLVDGVDVGAFKDDYDAKVDQSVRTTAEPTFANIHSLVDGVDVGVFKNDYDSKVDQSVTKTAEPEFANVHSLVDGVDVGAFKNDYDSKVDQSVKTTTRPTFAGVTTSASLLPSAAGTIDIGTATQYFRELRLGRGNGRVGIGLSLRVAGQAELYLNASGNTPSEITFGTNELARANAKWALTSYDSARGNNFGLMRGPALTDPGASNAPWETIVDVVGSGTDASQVRFQNATDSVSTTTGAVRFYGGVGIAKTLHAASVVTGALSSTSVATESLTIGGSPVDITGFVTLAGDQTITGQKTFGQTLLPSGDAVDIGSSASRFRDVYVASVSATGALSAESLTVDGVTVDPGNLVTLDGAQDITGAKVFKGGLYINATDLATLDWDNIKVIDQPLNKDSYSVEFNAMQVGQLKVDGMWLEPATYVTLGGAQTLGGQKTFGQTLLPSSTAVDIGSPSSKFGNVYTANLRADTVYAGGSEINFNNLVTIFEDQVITGQKTFMSSIMPGGIDTDLGENTNRFRSIYAWGIATQSITVNGTNIDFGSYVTLGGNQTISGQKTFSGQVKVGTHNLTTMPWQHLSGVDQDLNQTSAVTFASVDAASLSVGGTAVTPASYVTLGGTQTITGDKTFSGALSAASLLVGGTAVTPASYVTLGGTQTITGDKTFSGSLTVDVGGGATYNLATMPWQHLSGIDQGLSQTSAVTFAGLTTGALTVAGTAVTPTNYVTLDGTQTITGDKTFSGSLAVDVGGGATYDLTTMPWQFLQGVDQNLSQTSAVTFADLTTGALSATSVTVGGTAITPASYVTLDGMQTITGDKTFSGQINVSGYDLSTMPWQHLQDVDQDLSQTSAVTFAGVTASAITVPGLTAGLLGATAAGTLQSLALASTNGVTATVAGSTLTINTPQNLQMTAAPTFADLWFTGAPFSVGHALQWLNQGVTMDSSPQFAGVNVTGNASAGNLEVYGNTTTDTLTVGGTAVTPLKYVTTDTNQNVGGNKTFLADLLPGGTYVNIGRQDNIFGVLWCNSTWTNHIRVGSSILPNYTPPAPPGPVNIGSAESPFNIVYCNDVKINGQSVTPVNYVTTDTAQTVTATKTFAADVTFGTANFGRVRFSTYDGGRNRIESGWTTDTDYFMEFYLRNVKAMEIRNGNTGSPADSKVNMPGTVTLGHMRSSVDGRRDIGSTSQRFRRLYLGSVESPPDPSAGIIAMGHGIRATNRAELHLHSTGDQLAEIFFGIDGRIDSNVKWVLSSRPTSDTDVFRLMRGPKLAGGSTFSNVLDVVGSGTNAGQFKLYTATDAVSTTTGSATFAGGVGIAKTLHAKDIVAESLTLGGMPMYRQARKNDTLYTLNVGTYNTSTTPDIHMVRIGNQITLTFRLVTFTIATGQPTHLAMYMAIPPDFRPQHHINHAMFLTVNNTYPIQAMCTIDNQGNINIAPIPQVYYTGATNRVEPFSISFCHYVAP